MVSDFFIPSLGGVEMHIFNVAQCLIKQGHHVVVLTGQFSDERVGVRYLSYGLKVYHLPLNVMYDKTAYPDFLTSFTPILRHVFIRENIDIMHGH